MSADNSYAISTESAKEGGEMSENPTSFHDQVSLLMAQIFAIVQACPAGRVTTYGWIAKAVSYPRGARMVGMIMNEASSGVPAQRVINSKGELSGSWAFGEPERMRLLLEAEGIVFSPDERVNLKQYGWDPSRDLTSEELHHILEAAVSHSAGVSQRLLKQLRIDPASPFRIASHE